MGGSYEWSVQGSFKGSGRDGGSRFEGQARMVLGGSTCFQSSPQGFSKTSPGGTWRFMGLGFRILILGF